jgi:hypothetical protein
MILFRRIVLGEKEISGMIRDGLLAAGNPLPSIRVA